MLKLHEKCLVCFEVVKKSDVFIRFLRYLSLILRIFDASLQFATARVILDVEVDFAGLMCMGLC